MQSNAEIDSSLERIRNNAADQQAWREFYLYFKPRLAVVLTFLGAGRESLDDLCQETMRRFLSSSPWSRTQWQDLPEPGQVLQYLRRSAKNLLIDEHRSASRRVQSLDDILEGEEPVALRQDWVGLENEKLQDALKKLTKDEKTLLLHRALGYSLRESAQTLGISEAAATVRFHRLRKRLRREEQG